MVSPKENVGIILRLSGKKYHFSPGVTPREKRKCMARKLLIIVALISLVFLPKGSRVGG